MLIYLQNVQFNENRSIDRGRWPISSDGKLLETHWRLIPRAAPTALGRKRQQKPSSSEAAPSRLRVGSEGSRRAAYGKSMRACLCLPKVVAAPCSPQRYPLSSPSLCAGVRHKALALRPERRSGFRSIPPSTPSSTWAVRRASVLISPFLSAGSGRELQFGISQFQKFPKVRPWAVSVSPFISHPPSPLTLLPVFWSFRYRRRLSLAPPFQSRHVNTTAPRLQQRGRQRPAAAQYEARACKDEQRAARRADATDSPPSLEPTARYKWAAQTERREPSCRARAGLRSLPRSALSEGERREAVLRRPHGMLCASPHANRERDGDVVSFWART